MIFLLVIFFIFCRSYSFFALILVKIKIIKQSYCKKILTKNTLKKEVFINRILKATVKNVHWHKESYVYYLHVIIAMPQNKEKATSQKVDINMRILLISR